MRLLHHSVIDIMSIYLHSPVAMLWAKNCPVGDLSLVLYEMFGENCRATRRTKSERHVSSVNHCVVNGHWQCQLTMTDHLASVCPSLWSTTDSFDTAVSVCRCRKDTLVQAFVSSLSHGLLQLTIKRRHCTQYRRLLANWRLDGVGVNTTWQSFCES